MPLYILQLLVLIIHLLLLSLYSLALHLLVRRVLTDERETAVHLGQVLGTEDKHQLVLHRMMSAHISHRTDILVLSILQLLLKGLQLCLQDTDVSIDMKSVKTDSKWEAQTEVSDKYKKVAPEDVLGKLMSM